MIDTIIEKAKGFLLDPVETFRKSRGDGAEPLLAYYAIIVLVHAILATIVALILGANGISALMLEMVKQLGMEMPLLGGVGAVVVIIVIEIVALVSLFILGGWMHIFIYLFGGRKGYLETVKAFGYGSTPNALIGWIPFIGPFIGGIWSIVLWIIGIREFQEMSTGKAVAAVLVAVVVALFIIVLIAAFFFIAVVSTMPV